MRFLFPLLELLEKADRIEVTGQVVTIVSSLKGEPVILEGEFSGKVYSFDAEQIIDIRAPILIDDVTVDPARKGVDPLEIELYMYRPLNSDDMTA